MTQSTTPQAKLWYRLSEAIGAHDPDPDDVARIIAAYEAAGPEGTWEDLPEEIRQLVEQMEELPATSWEDPSDVPDDTSHLDAD